MNENNYRDEQSIRPIQQETIQDGKERTIIKNHFSFFGLATAIYALFYTFCLYKNSHGITLPFFVGGTLYYFCLCMKKLEVPLKKDAIFYVISTILLGISMFCTADMRIIRMNYWGILILLLSFLLHHFYQDEKWAFGKYLGAMLKSVVNMFSSCKYPFGDMNHFFKEKKQKQYKGRTIKYVILGLIIAFPMLLIISVLLASADAIFAEMTGDIITFFLREDLSTLIGIGFRIVAAYFVMYCLINTMAKRGISEETKEKKNSEPIIAITVTSLLSFVYLLFSMVQVVGLFMGQLSLPAGMSYAGYAREGFFQLLAVCIINLILVLICMTYFKESSVLKVMLSIISICTYIMIASSAYRMILYIEEFQLTFLRIFVLWSLLVIFILMIGVLVTIYQGTFPLFRFSMLVVTVLYVIFSFSHPDYFVAKYNLAKMYESAEVEEDGRDSVYRYGDLYYLAGLSADAAPALAEARISDLLMKYTDEDISYFDSNKTKNLKAKIEEMTSQEGAIYSYFSAIYRSGGNGDVRRFNLSEYIAKKAAEEYYESIIQ